MTSNRRDILVLAYRQSAIEQFIHCTLPPLYKAALTAHGQTCARLHVTIAWESKTTSAPICSPEEITARRPRFLGQIHITLHSPKATTLSTHLHPPPTPTKSHYSPPLIKSPQTRGRHTSVGEYGSLGPEERCQWRMVRRRAYAAFQLQYSWI